MKVHEYQGKEIFRNYNIPTPKGISAFSLKEAVEAYNKLDSKTVVIKAQIHAGGRGKGGGVKLAHNLDDVKLIVNEILGMNLITHQTGPEGKDVQRLLVESGVEIANEFYAAITLDRNKEMDVFMVSQEGGVDIEKVADDTPDKIIKAVTKWNDNRK